MKLLLGVMALLAFSAGANQITFPEVYDVLKVDGQERISNFFERKTEIPLTTGRHVILYRYNELFEDDDDGHTKIKSEPYVLVLQKGQESVVVNNPDNLDEAQARKYAELPKLSINSESGAEVVFKTFALSEFEQQQYRSVLDSQTEKVLQTSEKKQTVSGANALNMLNYWWQQATEQERTEFLKQIQH